ncbi:MAG: hypothetical protein ABFD16_14520 [Thermoguttaceae bacterium]
MGIRPRTSFVLKLKARRCSKCGAKLRPALTRCKRCASKQGRPKK